MFSFYYLHNISKKLIGLSVPLLHLLKLVSQTKRVGLKKKYIRVFLNQAQWCQSNLRPPPFFRNYSSDNLPFLNNNKKPETKCTWNCRFVYWPPGISCLYTSAFPDLKNLNIFSIILANNNKLTKCKVCLCNTK